jgi:hypothetical protein
VYRKRWHRTLNLICCDFRFRFIRAAIAIPSQDRFRQPNVFFLDLNELGMVSDIRINIGEGRPPTRSVLAAADFNELLDIGDFFWHRGENG